MKKVPQVKEKRKPRGNGFRIRFKISWPSWLRRKPRRNGFRRDPIKR